MQTLKAIIFDMDGTLADTEEIHRQSFNSAFEQFGIPHHWTQAEYKQLLSISGGRERIRQYLYSNPAPAYEPAAVDDLAVIIHTRKSEIYRQRLIDGHVGFRSGVHRLINEALQAGIILAIATSSSTRNVETLLKMALGEDALTLFKVIVTCDIIDEKKPSPAVYQHVLVRLGLEAKYCIALEDTHNGNMAATSAGLKTLITTHMFTTDDDFTGAALVVNQLGEPGYPFTVMSGNAFKRDYVDLQLLDLIVSNGRNPDTEVNHPGPDAKQLV